MYRRALLSLLDIILHDYNDVPTDLRAQLALAEAHELRAHYLSIEATKPELDILLSDLFAAEVLLHGKVGPAERGKLINLMFMRVELLKKLGRPQEALDMLESLSTSAYTDKNYAVQEMIDVEIGRYSLRKTNRFKHFTFLLSSEVSYTRQEMGEKYSKDQRNKKFWRRRKSDIGIR